MQHAITTADDLALNVDAMENLDDLVNALASLFDVSMASVSITGGGQQILIASCGLDYTFIDEEDSFCHRTVSQAEPLIVANAIENTTFSRLPMVREEPHIRFYAGFPLFVDGMLVGALWLADPKPRTLSETHKAALIRISQIVSNQLSLGKELEQLFQERGLIEASPIVQLTWRFSKGLKLTQVSQNCERILGISHEQLMRGDVTLQDLMTRDSEEQFTEAINYHQEGVPTHSCRLCMTTASRHIWLSMLSTATFNANGDLRTIQAFLFDTSDQKYIEDRLNETNQRMRLLLEASELGTWDWNMLADVNQVNSRWGEMLGLSIEDYDPSVRYFRQLIHPADVQQVERALNEHIEGKRDVYSAQFRMRHAKGHWVWVETYGKVVERDEHNKPVRLAGIHRDITQRMEQELTEKKKTQLLKFINKARAHYLTHNDLTGACQAILPELIDISDSQFAFIGEIIEENGTTRLFIHATSEISWDASSSQLVQRYRDRDLYFESFDNLFGRVITTGDMVLSNTPASHPSSRGTPKGHPRITRFLGLPIKLKDNTVGMIGLANKTTGYTEDDARFMQPLLDALSGLFYAVGLEAARAKAEERLRELAMTDALSGLPNRRAFMEKSRLVEESSTRCCIAIIDIDFFKKVNDTFGHDAGDEVIRRVAQTLRATCRSDDYLARLGGEEFAVILDNTSKSDAMKVLEKMRKSVHSMTVKYGEHALNVTISLGATLVTDCEPDAVSQHLNLADSALYEAKAGGRNQLCWYNSEAQPKRA
ncbi:diguanylate cyclase [Alteromonas sp. CYL-A6]|uniref:diguanylate cyclase n=1 Tax=Alteromonas nitratireducens TaxID=3390813 RepID=UPI0034B0957D